MEKLTLSVPAPANLDANFAYICEGDCIINARIFDGDIVYIHQQETVDDGDIAAVLVDDKAMLKRVRIYDDHISLVPENPKYKPLVYWGSEMNNVQIIGKAVAVTHIIRN